MNRGVIYVAYGPAARREAEASIRSLKGHTSGLSVSVVSDRSFDGVNWISCGDPGWGARGAKLQVDLLSPYDLTLYLDADTRVRGDIRAGFEIIAEGWDLAIAPSRRQRRDILGHLPKEDRLYTFEVLETSDLLNLQAGVFFFARSQAVQQLFAAWREAWRKFEQVDQGALLRALYAQPVKVWLLGREWNGGSLVEHRYGAAVSR